MPKFLDVTDKSFARAVLGADGGKTVNVGDYRDGVLSDNQVIAAAFDDLEDGGSVRFEQGRTYTISAALDLDLTGLDNVLIDGQGATLNVPVFEGRALTVRGTDSPTSTTLSTAITARTRTLSVASSAGFAAGDIVMIKSDTELFNSERNDYFKQDIARVASVSVGTILLDAPTCNSYSITGGATVTVSRYIPVRNLKIRDLTITGPGNAENQFGLTVSFFDGVDISNIRVDGISKQGVVGTHGIDFKVSNSSVSNCNEDGYGYGFIVGEVHAAKFVNCYGSNNRHSFDADGARDVLFMGCTAEGDRSAGISTHGNTDMSKIIGCTVRDCGGGIIVRGLSTLVKDNTVTGTRRADDSSQTYQYGIYASGVLGGTELLVDGNHVDTSGPSIAEAAFRSDAPLNRATITNNYFGGCSNHVVFLAGAGNNEVRITDNYVDCTDQDPTLAGGFAMGILMADAVTADANIDTDIDIDRNVITGALHTGIRVQGSNTASPVSDRIRIRNNRIGACGTNPISVISGNFGSNVQVYGNLVTAALNLTGTFAAGPLVNNPDITVGTVAVSSKTTPADADLLPLVDSAASNALKKLTWANLKTGAQSGLAKASDVQVFTSNGTWTKPAGAVTVTVRCIGAGGGGGAGARGASGTALSGGGGGAAGGMSEITVDASDLTATVGVTVGAGGVGASGQTVDSTAGAAGSASAANTLFGSYVAAFRGGGGGGGGLAVAGTAGSGQSGGFSYGISDGATGGAGSATGAAGAAGGRTGGSAGGGGGGGGITTAPAATAGGGGGFTMINGALSVGTAGNGAAGGNGSASTIKSTGTGGGGGGGNTTGAGYAGGNGGAYGAGGGGGGAALNTFTSGAGGNGGNGICIVTTYF